MMKPVLLVTGGGGFVAGSVLAQGAREWQIHAVSRGARSAPDEIGWHKVDITHRPALEALLDKLRPRAVIHTAAIASIDYCEFNRTEARLVNTLCTAGLASACAERDIRLVFCSTDNVFDGERGGYTEDDPASPVNFYGRTKADAEKAVLDAGANAVVARIAVVMGLRVLGEGNSFLARMIELLRSGKPLGVPEEEIRTPVDVLTLGQALLELAGNDYRGILHLAGNTVIDRCTMARQIAAHLGYAPSRVVPNNPSELPDRAPRPLDISLDNRLARHTLATPMLDLDEAINKILGRAGLR
jgi:dTDP-4-dehydrorhamnose reductase